MYCTYCGKEIPDDSQFCGYCGKASIRPDAVPQSQPTVPPHMEAVPPLPDSRLLGDVPLQSPTAAKSREIPKEAPAHRGKPIIMVIAAVLALVVVAFGALYIIGNKMTKETIRQVQNGYLGGYDDVTINELLTYLMDGFEVTWDGWTSGSGMDIVEVRLSSGDKGLGSDIIQFEVEEGNLFHLEAIQASGLDASNTAEVILYLNQLYYQYYLLKTMGDDIDADDSEIIDRMGDMPFGAVKYGTPANYRGNRLDSCLSRAIEAEKKYTVGEIMGWPQRGGSTPTTPSSGNTVQYSAYDYIISQYATALREGWDFAPMAEDVVNYMCRYYSDPSELGYALMDINNNGTYELIIGEVGQYGNRAGFFFDLYTMNGDQAALVASSTERDRYYLCYDGYIENEGSESAFFSWNVYRQFHKDGYLLLEDALFYEASYEGDGYWSYSKYSTMPSDRSYVSDEEAYQIMGKYSRIPITFTPFA